MIRVNGKPMAWHGPMTVADLLNALNTLDAIAVVRIDGKLISRPAFETCPIPDGAEIYLLPLISGG